MNPPPSIENIKDPFGKFIAHATGIVPDYVAEDQAWFAEMELVRSMFTGQPWTMCTQCPRPMRLTRQRQKTRRVKNPAAQDAVPIGAAAPAAEIVQPRPTYGVYAFMCTGKDPDAGRDVPDGHPLVYRSIADLLGKGLEYLTPRVAEFVTKQKTSPADPLFFFTPEEIATYGQWSYLKQDVIDAATNK